MIKQEIKAKAYAFNARMRKVIDSNEEQALIDEMLVYAETLTEADQELFMGWADACAYHLDK